MEFVVGGRVPVGWMRPSPDPRGILTVVERRRSGLPTLLFFLYW